jgi:mannose-6-phosphate isomerase-like protein (cupin superfamily)
MPLSPEREERTVRKVNLLQEAAKVPEYWGRITPLQFNDYDVHVNRIKGEYVWHSHADTDDVFLVLSGRVTIQLRTGDVELEAGEMFVVPAGIEHCPRADEEALIMVIEPQETAAAGDRRRRLSGARGTRSPQT